MNYLPWRYAMSKDIIFIKWFNNISECMENYLYMDIALLDFGFTDHSWIKGLVAVKKNLTMDEFKCLADEVFFENLRDNVPNKLRIQSDNEPVPEIGSIVCLIDSKKQMAQYNYKKKELLFLDESNSILNPEDMINGK